MLKKVVSVLLCLLIVFGLGFTAFAEEPPVVAKDGEKETEGEIVESTEIEEETEEVIKEEITEEAVEEETTEEEVKIDDAEEGVIAEPVVVGESADDTQQVEDQPKKGAATGFAAFTSVPAEMVFTDVKPSAYYYKDVGIVLANGLTSGVNATTYAPDKSLTHAEVITFAVRIYEKYTYGKFVTSRSGVWYSAYYTAAKNYGIIDNRFDSSPEVACTRAEAAWVFSNCLPSSGWAVKNDNILSVYDVSEKNQYYAGILKLYRAGVLAGSEEKYASFKPNDNITRGQIASIMSRIIIPNFRHTVDPWLQVITYGSSGEYISSEGSRGKPLQYIKIGNGPKALVLTYVVHGTEDVSTGKGSISGDGKVIQEMVTSGFDNNLFRYKPDGPLVTSLMNIYSSKIKDKWTVYIIPAVNPDGLERSLSKGDGSFKTGAGRRTEWRVNSNSTVWLSGTGTILEIFKNSFLGKLSNSYVGDGKWYLSSSCYGTAKPASGGIDLNRSFYVNGHVNLTNNDIWNGTANLLAPEAVGLRELGRSIKATHGSNAKYMIDTHGWYTQLLTTSTMNTSNIFYKAFIKDGNTWKFGCQSQYLIRSDGTSTGSKKQNSNNGYISNWFGALGFNACLFEFPSTVYTPTVSYNGNLNGLRDRMNNTKIWSKITNYTPRELYINAITYIIDKG